jgi:hypothetical protein
MPSDPSTPPGFSERGVAMVEFAVVLPVLAMLVAGVVEFESRVRAKMPPPILDSLLIVSGVKAMYRTYSVLETLPPRHARSAALHSDGVIVGTAIVRRMLESQTADEPELSAAMFVEELVIEMRPE